LAGTFDEAWPWPSRRTVVPNPSCNIVSSGFRPFRARLKGTSDGQPAQGIIVELDLQGGVSHQLIETSPSG